MRVSVKSLIGAGSLSSSNQPTAPISGGLAWGIRPSCPEKRKTKWIAAPPSEWTIRSRRRSAHPRAGPAPVSSSSSRWAVTRRRFCRQGYAAGDLPVEVAVCVFDQQDAAAAVEDRRGRSDVGIADRADVPPQKNPSRSAAAAARGSSSARLAMASA